MSDPSEHLPEKLGDALAQLDNGQAALNGALLGYSPDDWREAVHVLRWLRAITDVLAQLDGTLVTWLYLNGEHGLHQLIDGVPGEVHVTRGRKREVWSGREAVNDFIAAKMEAIGGEWPEPETVVSWVLELVPLYASTSLRKTPLKDAGLEVADYYTSEPGKPQVSVPPLR